MSLDSFMLAFREQTRCHPLAGWLRLWQNRAVFEVQKQFGKSIRLGCVQSFERGKGHGSAALDWFCKLADEHQVTISGSIKALGDKPRLNASQLRAWYKRRGFTVTRQLEITRLPKEVK